MSGGAKLDHILQYETMMKGNSNYKVTVHGLAGGKSVSGILNAPMPIAGSNEFDTLKSMAKESNIGRTIMAGMDIASAAMQSVGHDSVLSVEATRKIWKGSKTPTLSVEITFWSVDSHATGRSPQEKVKLLYSALFPEKVNALLIRAPLGYKWDGTNTLSLSIGQWFRAGGLVMHDAHFTPSLEVSSTGQPLYYSGSVSLEPYKMITYAEYTSWFLKPPIRPKFDSKESIAPKTDSPSSFTAQANNFLGQFKAIG